MFDISRAESVPGYMGGHELRWLAEQASRAQTILEIGVWKGRTTTVLCTHCPGTVYSIDNFMGSPGFPDDTRKMVESAEVRLEVMCEAFKNLQEFRESGKLVLLPVSVDEARGLLWWIFNEGGDAADFFFIDGSHDAQSVDRDILLAKALCEQGAVIAGHDYSTNFPGVMAAVDAAFPEVEHGPGTIWYKQLWKEE